MAMVGHSGMDDCFDKSKYAASKLSTDSHQKTRESNEIMTAGVTPAVQATIRQQRKSAKRTKRRCFMSLAALAWKNDNGALHVEP